MDTPSGSSEETQRMMDRLVEGFEALQQEYQRIWSKSQVLERNLIVAREQYDRAVLQTKASSCPRCEQLVPGPLELETPSTSQRFTKTDAWLLNGDADMSERNITTIRAAIDAAAAVYNSIHSHNESSKVRIHSGPSADKPSLTTSSTMPSISESPLEQDFTTSGTPSKLGCPFASMANRRLSKHAASVVSRYRPSGTATPRSSISRLNELASSVTPPLAEPAAQPETCGMVASRKSPVDLESSAPGSTGVCPIRFLDDRPPEEVAAYFESHKHELPRSHEVCVKRYQSNEDSIKQLDAKYGNLVSMIQGLGQKHAPMLPEKVGEADESDNESDNERESAERVRRWASSVSAQDADADIDVDAGEDMEDRQPHFDRPLKDVRIGESPSRPWGIQVPISASSKNSNASSAAAAGPLAERQPDGSPPIDRTEAQTSAQQPPAKCPFGFDAKSKSRSKDEPVAGALKGPQITPVFVPSQTVPEKLNENKANEIEPRMVFTGPVFIGFTPEQAASLLQATSGKNT